MNGSRFLARMLVAQLLSLCLAAGVVRAETEELDAVLEPDPQEAVEPAPHPEGERQVEALEQKGGWLGYSFVEKDGYGGRAMEYGLVRSSRSGGVFYRNLQQDSNLELEGNFLNQHDYHGDLLVDYRGDYRLHLRTESLYHNLDREILFSPAFRFGRTDAATLADYRSVQDAPQDYGIGVVQDWAEFRYRLHNYPMHLNLGYWSLVREGSRQQRFADTSFEGSPNTVYAERRDVEQHIREGRLGVDAHLGPVDVIYDFRARFFKDKNPVPVAEYVDRNNVQGQAERVGGLHQHNEDPDSRFLSHTVKLHTSLTGGVVATASYSVERRENLSRLTDTTGFKHAKVHLQNGAGDLVYTPSKEYSLALKYRRQELDHDNHTLTSNNFVDQVQTLRPSMDITRDIFSATLSYRPARELSLTGEYRGRFTHRDNVSDLPSPATWALPEHSETHTGTLSAYWRPVRGARTSASYGYATTENPSYGASAQKRHEGKLFAGYTRNNSWGATANAVVRREWNDEVERSLVDFPLTPLSYTAYPLTSRERRSENSNLGVWWAPLPGLTLGANYVYLHTHVDQAVLFTGVAAGSEAASEFTSRSHVYGVNATYTVTEALDLSLALQQVKSRSDFTPEAVTFSASADTSGIREITRQKTFITSVSARGEYRFTPAISSIVEYSLRDYDEKNPEFNSGNGTVHAVVASVAAKWD